MIKMYAKFVTLLTLINEYCLIGPILQNVLTVFGPFQAKKITIPIRPCPSRNNVQSFYFS